MFQILGLLDGQGELLNLAYSMCLIMSLLKLGSKKLNL